MTCRYAAVHMRILDEDQPGWTVATVWCRFHRAEHQYTAPQGQRALFGDSRRGELRQVLPRVPRGTKLEDGTLCFHGDSRPGGIIWAACTYCATRLHVHAAALAAVKSGRHGAGYLTEWCPACHRAQAVYPAYGGLGGVRTGKLADGAPVMQLRIGGQP